MASDLCAREIDLLTLVILKQGAKISLFVKKNEEIRALSSRLPIARVLFLKSV